jgi:hypothetical protein
VIPRKRARMLYLDHVESDRRLLFEEVLKMDLEGIVWVANSCSLRKISGLQDRRILARSLAVSGSFRPV